jgi:hypothetical protein
LILNDVLGSVLILVAAINAVLQFTKLGTRRSSRVSQVISARAGTWVRLALCSAAVGVWRLVGGWAVVGVMGAIIVWELAVWLAAWIRRLRLSRAV